MADKWILIVDDEEAILSVLKGSLRRLGAEFHVLTAADGYQALEQLKLRTFDLVVTDYKMAGMNGLELLEAIHAIQPDTRVILMTAYGNDALESEAHRKQAYSYITKPLEIETFRQVVRDALEDLAISRPGILILSDERYRQVNQLLAQLQADIAARCIFLTDGEGHFIARVGNVDKLPLEQIASLVGGSVATLLEAGRVIDGETDTINLSYREGKQDNLYVVNIGRQLLLIVVIERGPYSSRLGTVWYYAQQAALTLREKLGEADFASPRQMFDGNLEFAVESELDKLFDDPFTPAPVPPAPASKAPASKAPVSPTPVAPPAGNAPPSPLPHPAENEGTKLLSFKEAVAAGLVEEKINQGSSGEVKKK